MSIAKSILNKLLDPKTILTSAETIEVIRAIKSGSGRKEILSHLQNSDA
jgi:hypothetical protein